MVEERVVQTVQTTVFQEPQILAVAAEELMAMGLIMAVTADQE